MAWTNLFVIGTTDLTQWEQKENHDVNREEFFEEWTDGNKIIHRDIWTRVNGSVVLSFSRESDHSNFMSLLTSARNANGYYPIKVWCSNTNSTETVNAFLTVTGDTKWDVTAPIKHHTVNIGITGRGD